MSETIWRVADKVRARYRSVAQPGLRGGAPGGGPINAAQAEAYREVLGWLLAEMLGRSPTRDEIARWLAGQPLPIPDLAAPAASATFAPSRPPVPPLPASATTPVADGLSASCGTSEGVGATPTKGASVASPSELPDRSAPQTEVAEVIFAGSLQ